MKLLVLHRIPYHKVSYHRGIDHTQHDVTYIGTAEALQNIPADLRCQRWVRPGKGNVADEVLVQLEKRRGRKHCFDRVISLSEYELLDAAQVREALGITGPKLAEVE